MVNAARYIDGQKQACGDISDELALIRQGGGGKSDFLWIGLHDPTEAEFDLVRDELGMHSLAVEDALGVNQRAKIEVYPKNVFAVIKTLRYLEETSDIETGEISLFVGDAFVVTVRRGAGNPLAQVRANLEMDVERLKLGPWAVFHAVADSIVDNYVRIDAAVAQDIEEIEEMVFGDAVTDTAAIYRLKREVLEFRRAVLPLTAAILGLHRDHYSPARNEELRRLFRDVSDHLQGVADHIETYERLLADVLSAYVAQTSMQQNDDMRKIASIAAIAAVPTMVAGIYGMNFEFMPELKWVFGYPLVLSVMFAACLGMFIAFRRTGWL